MSFTYHQNTEDQMQDLTQYKQESESLPSEGIHAMTITNYVVDDHPSPKYAGLPRLGIEFTIDSGQAEDIGHRLVLELPIGYQAPSGRGGSYWGEGVLLKVMIASGFCKPDEPCGERNDIPDKKESAKKFMEHFPKGKLRVLLPVVISRSIETEDLKPGTSDFLWKHNVIREEWEACERKKSRKAKIDLSAIFEKDYPKAVPQDRPSQLQTVAPPAGGALVPDSRIPF